MPAAWRKMTCTVCGAEFMSQSPQAKYCSEECRRAAKRDAAAEWKKKTDAWKAQSQAVREQLKAQEKEKKHFCKGCIWKTPGGHVCVMPTCLRGLGRAGERHE